MDSEIPYRQVSIQPIELLKRAKEMLGEQYWLFVGITLVGAIIGQAAPLWLLMGPMMCGIYLCYLQRASGKPANFELLFKGFDFFTESLIATLVMLGVSLLVTIPMGIIFMVVFIATMAASEGEAAPLMMLMMPFGYIISLALMILVTLPFTFIYPLITERGLKAMPAVKTSYAAVKANFGGVFKMIMLYMIISIAGCCVCYVPAILFLPLSLGGIFLAYRDIFPLENKPIV